VKTEQLQAGWKFALSFFRRAWRLEDYPIRLRALQVDPDTDYGHLKPCHWSAQIITWWTMSGCGDTRDAAIADLRVNLERWRSAKPLPRPGRSVQLEFAPTHRIEEHPDLAADFFHRIFDMDYAEVWISDDSSLWDFEFGKSLDQVYEKILLTYGVDVSDIAGAKLAPIVERLVSRGAAA
jgi:hypothetical protein